MENRQVFSYRHTWTAPLRREAAQISILPFESEHKSLFKVLPNGENLSNFRIKGHFAYGYGDPFWGPTQQALRYYSNHYEMLDQWIITPGRKYVLGDRKLGPCRFCKRRYPEVSFKSRAHAIPECLGNKSIFTKYECDECNTFFGLGIENDFGNWSKPYRALYRIFGKNGIPTIKDPLGGWRIEFRKGSMYIDQRRESNFFSVNEITKEIVFSFKRDPYRPANVLKAFMKMGLSLISTDELENFSEILNWVRSQTEQDTSMLAWPVIQSFLPGSYRGDVIALATFRRMRSVKHVPYAFFTITYGNEMFQIYMPSPLNDQDLMNRKVELPPYPHLLNVALMLDRSPKFRLVDLTGTELVRDEMVNIPLSYGHSAELASAVETDV